MQQVPQESQCYHYHDFRRKTISALVTCVMAMHSLTGVNPFPQKPQIPLQIHLRWSQCICDTHSVEQECSIFTVLQNMHHR